MNLIEFGNLLKDTTKRCKSLTIRYDFSIFDTLNDKTSYSIKTEFKNIISIIYEEYCWTDEIHFGLK